MRGEPVDRAPYFEEGVRDEVIAAWQRQGLRDADELRALFPTDRRDRIGLNLEPIPDMTDRPAYAMHPEELRARLLGDPTARLPADWAERVREWRNRDWLVQLPIHRGFFLSMGVIGWDRFEPAIELLVDEPARVHALMDAYADCYVRLVRRVLSEVEVDFATFSEPIGGNNGPILSPAQYREFALGSYAPVLEALREGGVETIVFVTYANARALLPAVLEAGFDALWACEVETSAMDYRDLRKEFGPGLRLIGGIDLDVLLQDEDAIRAEIERAVPPLLAEGGYIPLADGRVRENVPYERYAAYRRVLEAVTREAPRSHA